MVSSPQSCILFEAAHRYRIELHQMEDLAIEKNCIPTNSTEITE